MCVPCIPLPCLSFCREKKEVKKKAEKGSIRVEFFSRESILYTKVIDPSVNRSILHSLATSLSLSYCFSHSFFLSYSFPPLKQAKSVCGQVGVRTCVPVCVYECVFVICVCVCVRVCRVGSAGKCNSRIPLNRIREESSSIQPSASQTASNIQGARIRQKNRHRRSASSSSNERNRIKTAPGDGEEARKRERKRTRPSACRAATRHLPSGKLLCVREGICRVETESRQTIQLHPHGSPPHSCINMADSTEEINQILDNKTQSPGRNGRKAGRITCFRAPSLSEQPGTNRVIYRLLRFSNGPVIRCVCV